jgi:hypothetical protein
MHISFYHYVFTGFLKNDLISFMPRVLTFSNAFTPWLTLGFFFFSLSNSSFAGLLSFVPPLGTINAAAAAAILDSSNSFKYVVNGVNLYQQSQQMKYSVVSFSFCVNSSSRFEEMMSIAHFRCANWRISRILEGGS